MQSFTKSPMTVIPAWDHMMRGARAFVEENGFTAVHNMPHVAGVSGSCEQFQSTFPLQDSTEFFGKQAFLVQSDQLYLESVTPLFGRVYCEIQSFRKEPVVDSRHLAQFTLFEIEHLGDLEELMSNIEGIVRRSIRQVAYGAWDALGDENRDRLRDDLAEPFFRMSYADALEELELPWGTDLKASHELALTEKYGPMFLTQYAQEIKFWNMREPERGSRVVNSCDLLLPFAGESAGASERETNYDDLVRRLKASDMYRMMKDQGVSDEEFTWYLDQHKDGDVQPHSGAGIGMARVAQYILGNEDIRDSVPFVVNKETLL